MGSVGGGNARNLPREYFLNQNFPNSLNPSTVIRYGLPAPSRVRLEVYNMIGQRVNILVDDEQEAGYHEVAFEGLHLASGVYFYRLPVSPSATRNLVPSQRDGHAGDFVETRKMLLIK
jgi:hypothetical protein